VNEPLDPAGLCGVQRVAHHDRMFVKLGVGRSGEIKDRVDAPRCFGHAIAAEKVRLHGLRARKLALQRFCLASDAAIRDPLMLERRSERVPHGARRPEQRNQTQTCVSQNAEPSSGFLIDRRFGPSSAPTVR
jgi:hypothetical protein